MYISAAVKNIFEEPWTFRHKIAKDPSASPALLAQLADDQVVEVRAAVAENPNTPADTLTKKLMYDPYNHIRAKAMFNCRVRHIDAPYLTRNEELSGIVQFSIPTTDASWYERYKDSIIQTLTDEMARVGYTLLSIEFLPLVDQDTFDEDEWEDANGNTPDDVEIILTVSSLFDEDDIDWVLDDITEILDHEYGVTLYDAGYHQLYNVEDKL